MKHLQTQTEPTFVLHSKELISEEVNIISQVRHLLQGGKWTCEDVEKWGGGEPLLSRMTLTHVCSETYSHPKRLLGGANSTVPGACGVGKAQVFMI